MLPRAIKVVNVKLLAVRPSWSSRKRSRKVRAVSSQGQVCRVVESSVRRLRQPARAKDKLIAL